MLIFKDSSQENLVFIPVLFILVVLITVLLPPCCAGEAPGPAGDWKLEIVEGEHFLQTRQYPEAEICFSRALEQVKRTPGHSQKELAQCMETLADVLYRQEKLEESLKLYRKALKVLEKVDGRESLLLVPTLKKLGAIYEGEGEFEKAGKYYTRALEIVNKVSGSRSFESALILHRLGRVQFEEDLHGEARESYYLALVNTLEQNTLPDSKFLEELLSDYTDLMRKSENRGRILKSRFQRELLEDRLELLSKKRGVAPSAFSKEVSVRIQDGTLPGSSDSSGNGLEKPGLKGSDQPEEYIAPQTEKNTADDGDATGDIKLSHLPADRVALEKINRQRIQFYERMIEVDIKSLGPDHPSVARDLSGLANVYLTQKKYDEARPLLLRVLKIYSRSYSPDSEMIKQTRLLLQLIASRNDEPGAYSFKPYLQKLPRIPVAAQTISVALRLNDLAFLCYCKGQLRKAKTLYTFALASTALSTGTRSLLSAASMADLSRVLRLTGRVERARLLESNARSIWYDELRRKRALLLPN